MIEHPGIYAIHCIEGKERTGLMMAVLEGLMGASYDEVKDDYLVTFYNYYGIRPGDEKCDIIVKALLDAELSYVLKINDPKTTDLKKESREYLREIGITDVEIEKLIVCIGKYDNPVKISSARKTVSFKKLKKKAQLTKPIKTKYAKGKITYKKIKNKKYDSGRLTLNKKNGRITVKKNTKRGTYKMKVRVTVSGDGTYKGHSEDLIVKVRVK